MFKFYSVCLLLFHQKYGKKSGCNGIKKEEVVTCKLYNSRMYKSYVIKLEPCHFYETIIEIS